MLDKDCAEGSLNPINLFKWFKFKLAFKKGHPDYFYPDGLFCFCGPQGKGKTLSAVQYTNLLKDKYPKSKLVTNLMLADYPIVTFKQWYFERCEKLNVLKDFSELSDEDYDSLYSTYLKENDVFEFVDNDSLTQFKNGEFGVIFLIDEIALYLNSLESKKVNMDTMVELAQQRKQRVHIVCTSQVFGRIAKPAREQFSNIIVCNNHFGFLQVNKLIDRDTIEDSNTTNDASFVGEVKHTFRWFHSPELYGKYDTYYKIQKGSFADGQGYVEE